MKIRGAVLSESGLGRPYAESRPLQIRELELADPGPDELLVKIEAAGLCHSDLSVVDGHRRRPLPMLLGHEAAGRVVALGEGVDDLEIGQQVMLSYLPACGACAGCATEGRRPCEPGSAANGAGTLLGGTVRLPEGIHHHLGLSAFATHAVVNRHSVVALPAGEEIPPQVAAVLGCAVQTGGGAIMNAGRLQEGETVAVVGLGAVGLAAVLVARALGAEVLAVDPMAAKRELAMEFGATRSASLEEAAGEQSDLVVEAAGRASAAQTALQLTAVGGRCVLVGLPDPADTFPLSPLDLVGGARTVIGSYMGSCYSERDIPKFIELWRAGTLPLEKLITGTTGFDGLNQALDDLADAKALRTCLIPDQFPGQYCGSGRSLVP